MKVVNPLEVSSSRRRWQSAGRLDFRVLHRARMDYGQSTKVVILTGALFMLAGIPAAVADSTTAALAFIAMVTFGFQSWINNVQTIPSDLFPQQAVAGPLPVLGTLIV